MSNFEVIPITNEKKWDEIVRRFKNYDVSYLSGYAKAFQIHGDGDPILFYYDDGSTKAINVVMKRDIALSEHFIGKLPLNEWFDISTPYGYGGLWIEGDSFQAVNDAYDIFCINNGFVSEFVRFHLFSDSHKTYSGESINHSLNVVRDLTPSLEEIKNDFEYSIRKNLKKANDANLIIEIDEDGKRLNEFLEIYYATMDRANAKPSYYFSKEFFNTINCLKGNFVYMHALFEGKIISTELVLYGTENCYSFLGGTSSEYFSLRPNDFLKYEIIKWAKNKGLKRFVLGGGYTENDGIFKFKKSFA
ncbi:MAG: GNAT family N-acetyltransferase, partial [Erysipelotrichaceae bacterium]